MRAEINSDRMAALLGALNCHGFDVAGGGYDRRAFNAADMAARRAFLDTMRADGLEAHIDTAGNVVGRFGPPGPAVVVGSHLDTVPSGGGLDGVLGCVVALECVRAMRDAGLALSRPVAIVATADEEGRFGGMLGSQALAGTVPDGFVDTAVDADGHSLADAMRAAGLDPARVAEAALDPSTVHSFLELHIEQGPVLEASGREIGIATGISGCAVLAVSIHGTANHSGTTPMDMRRDAFLGLSEVGLALPGIARRHGTADARLTVGHVELSPNQPHTIPGRADFTVIVRDVDSDAMDDLEAAIRAVVASVCVGAGLRGEVVTRSRLDPVRLDPALQRVLEESAVEAGLDPVSMPSGAGHDAQTMASLCPSALMFVPSRDGVSHAPEEHTDWDSILKGATVFLAAVVRLVTAGKEA